MVHSILIIGQSNMAGRGFPNEVSPIPNDNILVLHNGRWRSMYVPVNADRITAGINLVESFAQLYARDKNVDVGIIPCADGGTNLDQWQVGGLGDFLIDYFNNDNYLHINNALKQYADETEMTGFVSADGLRANPDNLHFSAEALREFGVRYYNEFLKIEDKNKVFSEKATVDHAIRTQIELL